LAQVAQDRQEGRDGRDHEQDRADHGRIDVHAGDVSAADQRQPDQATRQSDREQGGADHVDAAADPWSLPARRRGPCQGDRDDADRDVHVEDPAPGRGKRGGQRPALEPEPLDGAFDVDPAKDRRADERAGGHAEERQRADHAERARPVVALEQVRRGRRRHGNEHAATNALEDPRGDELVEVLRRPGQPGTDDEQGQCANEQPSGAPQVGEPAGQRHRDDVREQVAVDDPARLAQLDPGGSAGRFDEVDEDRRQCDGRDDELEAGEEDADPEHDQEDQRRSAIHRASLPAHER
jgi:hypothetical protein